MLLYFGTVCWMTTGVLNPDLRQCINLQPNQKSTLKLISIRCKLFNKTFTPCLRIHKENNFKRILMYCTVQIWVAMSTTTGKISCAGKTSCVIF